MKLLLENWRGFVKQEVEEFLPHAEVRAVERIGSSTLSPEEQAEQDLEKYGYVRDEGDRDFDIEVQIAGVSNEDVEEWAFSQEAEELENSYNYDVQLRIVENWREYMNEGWSAPQTQEDLDIAFQILEKAKIEGFSGACAEAAVAINNVLFDGEGTLVAAVNKYLWEKDGRMTGHVAVYIDSEGSYWDAEGEKDWEEIESWGMLDPEDGDYGFPNEEAAYEVIRLEPTAEELLNQFGGCSYSEKVQQLRQAKDEVLGI